MYSFGHFQVEVNTAAMPLIPWPARTSPSESPLPTAKGLVTEVKEKVASAPTPILLLSALAIGSVSTAAAAQVYRRFFRRFPNGDWVTPDVFAKKRWIKGFVTR